MAVYDVIGKAEQEAVNKMGIANSIRLPGSGEITYNPKIDMILGLHRISKYENSPETTYDGILTTTGRIKIFETVIPESYRTKDLFAYFNTDLTKSKITMLIDYMADVLKKPDWITAMDELCKVGFSNSHTTLSIFDFVIDRDSEFDPSKIDPSNNAKQMIESGARGSWDQYKQMAVKKGYVTDVNGQVRPHVIEKALIDGLGKLDFIETCHGGRKGLADTASRSADSGYFTRKLVYATYNQELDFNVDDCHALHTNREKGFLEFYIPNEGIAKSLIGRFLDSGEITKYNYKDFVGKTVLLRSPVTCSHDKICMKCYGRLAYEHNSKKIGVIAAQSLGERSLQLTLRTKHTSGASSDQMGDLKNHFNLKDGKLVAKVDGQFIIRDDYVTFKVKDHEYNYEDFEKFSPLCEYDKTYETGTFKKNEHVANVSIISKDIVSAVAELSNMFCNPEKNISNYDFIMKVVNIYGSYTRLALVHVETILSMMCRNLFDPYIPYRIKQEEGYQIMSILKLIEMQPGQAIAFERFSRYIMKMLKEGGTTRSLFEENGQSLLKNLLFLE